MPNPENGRTQYRMPDAQPGRIKALAIVAGKSNNKGVTGMQMTRQQRGLIAAAFVCSLAIIPALYLSAQQPEPALGAPLVVPTAQVPGTLPTSVDADRPSQLAVPTQEVPSPAAPSNLPESVAWGLGAAYVLESLKKSGWFTFLSDQSTKKAKVIFGFVAAFLTAAGIQFVVSGSVLDAGGASVTITGITFTGIKDVLFQWVAQQGWYDLVVHRRNAVASVQIGGARIKALDHGTVESATV